MVKGKVRRFVTSAVLTKLCLISLWVLKTSPAFVACLCVCVYVYVTLQVWVCVLVGAHSLSLFQFLNGISSSWLLFTRCEDCLKQFFPCVSVSVSGKYCWNLHDTPWPQIKHRKGKKECFMWSLYLFVSCLSRPSWAPSWWCKRWGSWEWVEFSALAAEWVGSAVVPESSVWGAKTGPNSASSSSTSSSFSAPSHSDAGPKWVCSSVGWKFKGQRSRPMSSFYMQMWDSMCPVDGAKSSGSLSHHLV